MITSDLAIQLADSLQTEGGAKALPAGPRVTHSLIVD